MPAVLCLFLADDTGAVAVDWVVLTAIAAGFAALVMVSLTSGTTDVATRMETILSSVEVAPVGNLGETP